jgi:hypothetical protein
VPATLLENTRFQGHRQQIEATGKETTSPFGLLARFEGGKVAYVQFLEDSYGTAGSFKTGGSSRFRSDPAGKEVEV